MKATKLTKETVVYYGLQERNFDKFRVGDRIEVYQSIVEAGKSREQKFEGDVISLRGAGAGKTFIVRRSSSKGVGVEKVFAYYSPGIMNVKKIKSGKVRRAKLYYLRDKVGKEAKVA